MAIFIAGPTAVGKSAIALAVAQRLGAEIISVDSMQVYRGLDLGTAKPTAAQRAAVPHHLIDICGLRDFFDAAQFVRRARQAAGQIEGRGRPPVFCGGTGLYFKAFLEGLGPAPAADGALRTALAALPREQLLAELAERDPAAYEQIDRQNPRRLIRALEVIRLTGRKYSAQRAAWEAETPAEATPGFFCLVRPPADLQNRIDARVDEMFALGLVEETRRLLGEGLEQNQVAMQAIGYRQVVEHLRGEHSLSETIKLVKARTRQFAKRQLTWFRRQARCRWLELKSDEPPADTAEKIIHWTS